jgi:hypothetical protein
MSMILAERVRRLMMQRPDVRLRIEGVPIAVVEDVLRLGFDVLADEVPAETLASEITAIDWDSCEACGHLIDPQLDDGHEHDSEGVVLCNACVVEDPANRPASQCEVKPCRYGAAICTHAQCQRVTP